jgi:choline kinase
MTSKAIIVAAGRGRRLQTNTEDIPKCMVPVAGRPILHWQLDALRRAGIDDIVIVRGYLGERIDCGGTRARFIENPEWERNNILTSLMYAKAELAGGFFFSYCDIVYAPAVVASLAAADASAAASLIVDRGWSRAYEGRTLHPVSEAELTEVQGQGGYERVVRVGKGAVPAERAVGEFIGLARFSAAGAAALGATWDKALAEGGPDTPFGRAKTLRQAYLTDALNAMADAGHRLAPVYIDGTWREIDTPQDLTAADAAAALWSR